MDVSGSQDATFEWDDAKNEQNIEKHGLSFQEAQVAFYDRRRVIARGLEHSQKEERWYCFGDVNGGIATVRFTVRNNRIRILGAGYWRKGKQLYEEENTLRG